MAEIASVNALPTTGIPQASKSIGRIVQFRKHLGPDATVYRAGISPVAVAIPSAMGGFFLMVGALLLVILGWRKRVRVARMRTKGVQVADDRCNELPIVEPTLRDLKMDEIEVDSLLGKGGFGKVYKGSFRGTVVAVKRIKHDGSALTENGESLEALLSKNVNHPNIVKTYLNQTQQSVKIIETFSAGTDPFSSGPQSDQLRGVKLSSAPSDMDDFSYLARHVRGSSEIDRATLETYIVMEFCDMGSLNNAILEGLFFVDDERTNPKLSHILLTALDIACALRYLHEKSIIHGDLKAQNVLLTSASADARGFCCKVGDFGLSRIVMNGSFIQTFTCGTVRYMPPELLKDGRLTAAADVYSFGMLVWELISGRQLYPKKRHNEIIVEVVDGDRPSIPSWCPMDIALLIQDCWDHEYMRRPSFKQIVDRLKFLLRLHLPLNCRCSVIWAVEEDGAPEVPVCRKQQKKCLVNLQTSDADRSCTTVLPHIPNQGTAMLCHIQFISIIFEKM